MFYKLKNWIPTLIAQFCRWFWIALKTECKILLLYIWSSIIWRTSTIAYHFLPFSPLICGSLARWYCVWFPENTLFFVTAVPWHMLAPLPLPPGWTWYLCSLSTLSFQHFPPGSFLWPAFKVCTGIVFSVFAGQALCTQLAQSTFPFMLSLMS